MRLRINGTVSNYERHSLLHLTQTISLISKRNEADLCSLETEERKLPTDYSLWAVGSGQRSNSIRVWRKGCL